MMPVHRKILELWRGAELEHKLAICMCVFLAVTALAIFYILERCYGLDKAIKAFEIWPVLAAIGAAYFFWGRNRALTKQAATDHGRLIEEHFLGAVKLLAQKDQDGNPEISARIGGVYALQSLANNCVRDGLLEHARQAIRILVSYIRSNVQRAERERRYDMGEAEGHKILSEDVKAAFSVLQQLLDGYRGGLEEDGASLKGDLSFSGQDFSNIDLSGREIGGLEHYSWRQADLRGANLHGANLRNVDLWSANLQDANLPIARLQGANLVAARLEGANLFGAYLQEAHLQAARLQGANLRSVQLQGVDLWGAELQGVDLQNANLERTDMQSAHLKCTNLRDVKVNAETKFPSCLNREIWHSINCSQLKEVKPRADDAGWDLSMFESSAALVGVLWNFALRGNRICYAYDERARALRKAACKLLDENNLPEGFPDDWRDWLASLGRKTFEEPSSK